MRNMVKHLVDSSDGGSFYDLLKSWDDAWLNYLSAFVVWKKKDAAAIEEEVRLVLHHNCREDMCTF